MDSYMSDYRTPPIFYRCIPLWLAQQLQIKLPQCTFGCLELNLAYLVQKPWTEEAEYTVIVELALL